MQKHGNTTRGKSTTLHQICNLIPPHLVAKLAREHGSVKDARSYSHWSHIVTLIYAQVSHCTSLNDVCDGLQLHTGPLSAIRGAVAPFKNTLSHANKERPAALAEALFWSMLTHLQTQAPRFGGGPFKGRLKNLRRNIHLIDSTTIELIAQCMPWAKHRRRKAAAKAHVRLDLASYLPGFVLIDSAREHDNKRARELCAGLNSGEIVVADRGYVDQEHFRELHERGVIWVTRWKENLVGDLIERRPVPAGGKILEDAVVALTNGQAARRITALVEVDGQEREMIFLTNQMEWSASTIVALYQSRWSIETFFKELKQNFQVADFLGNSANAVRWQVWMALLVQLLMRYLSWLSQWPHSFSRICTLIRGVIWDRFILDELLKAYGTAKGRFKFICEPQQAYFAIFR